MMYRASVRSRLVSPVRPPGRRRRYGLIAIFAMAMAVLPLREVAAQAMCSKPVQPLCMTDVWNLDDQPQRQRCLQDAATFEESMIEYRQCLTSALEEANTALRKVQAFRSCLDSEKEECSVEWSR